MKKSLLRLISLFLLVSVLAASLSACHGTLKKPSSEGIPSDNSGENQEGESGAPIENPAASFNVPESFDTSRTYEITFWAKNESNINQANVYRQAVKDFEALYPNIKIKLKIYTDYGRIYQDVITNISTDTTPNICITYPDHIATYMTGEGTMVPLNQLMDDEKYGLGGSELLFDGPTKEEIIPKFLEECAFGDTYYALPYMRSSEVCYINKTYVEKLGFTLPETLTWDFIWEVAEAATAKDADGNYIVNGQKTMIPIIYKSTDNMMIQMLRQSGAGYSTSNGGIKIFNNTTKDILLTLAEHAATGAFCTFKRIGYPANFLNAGQCIFAIDSTAGATWMGCDAPQMDIAEESIVRFETEVMTIPQFDTENPQMISQGPSVCIFNKEDPGEVLASWLFTQFLLTNEVQIPYATIEGYVPVTSKAQDSDEYKDYLSRSGEDNDYYYDIKIKTTQILLENIENTFVTPVFNGSTSLRNASGEMIEQVVKTARGKKTVDEEYIDKLYEDMVSLYKLTNIVEDDPSDPDSGEPQINNQAGMSGPNELGPLPAAAVALLVSLALVWVLILTYFAVTTIKKRKK